MRTFWLMSSHIHLFSRHCCYWRFHKVRVVCSCMTQRVANWWWFWLHLYSELTHVFSLTSAFNQHTFSLHLCTHILSLPLHSINTLIWPLLHSINTLFWPPLHLISTLFYHLCIQSTHWFDHFCIQSIHYFDHLCIQSTRILTMFMSVQLVSAILETLSLPPLQEDHNQFLMETVISSHWRP